MERREGGIEKIEPQSTIEAHGANAETPLLLHIPVAGVRGQRGLDLAGGGRHRNISRQEFTREIQKFKDIFDRKNDKERTLTS